MAVAPRCIHEHNQEERRNAFLVHTINLSRIGTGDDPIVYCFKIARFAAIHRHAESIADHWVEPHAPTGGLAGGLWSERGADERRSRSRAGARRPGCSVFAS